ncbi:MAG: DNRLRE domain-containing protein [Planctomycetota bacterium]|nr:DNRLRE domain-containing protein [Planctomycetota bacterium]
MPKSSRLPSSSFSQFARANVEPLESRTLLALVSGFESVKITRVTTEVATSMEFAPALPDGVVRLFVADSNNRQVRLLKNGVLQSTPALTFTSSEVDRSRERGIEAIAFHPNFASNKFVYLYYTKPDPAKPNTSPSNAVTRLVRYTMNSGNDTINKSSAVVILDDIPNTNGIHNGGSMHFGPDGMLYLGIGEGGVATDAQNLDKYGGKVLRINVNNPSSPAPTDNPYYNASNGIGPRDFVFAHGFRNPFTGGFKPGTNTLYINDVGGSSWEEINDVQRGKNYGWSNKEGNTSDTTYTNPVHTYTHYPNGSGTTRVPAAITGGAFYSGSQFPASYNGKWFFADEVRKFIKVFDPATKTVTDFHTNDAAILDVLDIDVAPDGSLWTLSVGGNIRRIRFVGQANRAPTANASANQTSGDLPLTVNFSGNGSTDPDGDNLTYNWNFGDGTTGTGQNVQHTYDEAGTYNAVLTVSDGRGGSNSDDPIVITAGSQAPMGTITTPTAGTNYGGGQTIDFSGAATDPEDGTLPASAFEWSVVFHHANHTHPFEESISGVTSGSFVIPTVGEQAPDQWYRVHLKVTDSDGVEHTSFRDVVPRTTTLTFNGSFAGSQITLDGEPRATPFNVLGVEGMTRVLGAPSPQTTGGKTYAFSSWSDGGAQTHDITTPVNDTAYTANFTQTAGPVDVSLAPRFDAYVRDGSFAGQNFGSDGTLVVKKSANAGNSRESYIKWDLTDTPVGPGQVVKLRVWGRLSDTTNDNLAVGLFAVSDTTWGETTLTWNNKPASAPTALATKTISGTTLKLYEFDVTTHVQNEKAAGRNGIGFALKRSATSDTQVWFNSDEAAANRPVLFVGAPTSTPTTTTIKTTVASYVRGGSFATQNFGSDPSLLVKLSASSDNIRESFIKFDLSSVSTINSGKLRLWGKLSAASSGGVTIGAYKSTNTTWGESTVNFNNRPVTNTGPLSTATVTGTGGAWFEWDLTSFLQTEKAAGRNTVTIALKATAITDPWAILNADGAASNDPQLLIT